MFRPRDIYNFIQGLPDWKVWRRSLNTTQHKMNKTPTYHLICEYLCFDNSHDIILLKPVFLVLFHFSSVVALSGFAEQIITCKFPPWPAIFSGFLSEHAGAIIIISSRHLLVFNIPRSQNVLQKRNKYQTQWVIRQELMVIKMWTYCYHLATWRVFSFCLKMLYGVKWHTVWCNWWGSHIRTTVYLHWLVLACPSWFTFNQLAFQLLSKVQHHIIKLRKKKSLLA